MELDTLAFEKKIFVKKDAAVLLTREIANKYRFAAGSEGAPETYLHRHGDRSVSAGGEKSLE